MAHIFLHLPFSLGSPGRCVCKKVAKWSADKRFLLYKIENLIVSKSRCVQFMGYTIGVSIYYTIFVGPFSFDFVFPRVK